MQTKNMYVQKAKAHQESHKFALYTWIFTLRLVPVVPGLLAAALKKILIANLVVIIGVSICTCLRSFDIGGV